MSKLADHVRLIAGGLAEEGAPREDVESLRRAAAIVERAEEPMAACYDERDPEGDCRLCTDLPDDDDVLDADGRAHHPDCPLLEGGR